MTEVKLLDGTKKSFKGVTWGLHQELLALLQESSYDVSQVYYNPELSKAVIEICLSDRDSQGVVTKKFTDFDNLPIDDAMPLLDIVVEYATDFFLNSNQKMKKVNDKFQNQSQ